MTATAIFAVAAVVVAFGFVLLVWRKGFKSLHFRLGGIEGTLEGIDKAVNHVPPGTPSIPERLDNIERDQEEMMRRLTVIAANQKRHHPEELPHDAPVLVSEEVPGSGAGVDGEHQVRRPG